MDNTQTSDLLKNKVILVTGAGDGIGAEASQAFAANGATVVLLGRTLSKLEKVYDKIEQSDYPKPAIYPLNLEGACDKDYEEMASVIQKEVGQLDGILHNAAYTGDSTPISQYDTEQWQRVLHVNLTAPFMLTRACIGLLQHSANSRIIFTVHRVRSAYWGAYGVAKAAIECLMQILADEMNEEKSMRINAIAPGELRSPLIARHFPGKDSRKVSAIDTVLPTYIYLMSEKSNGVNGKILDGSGNVL